MSASLTNSNQKSELSRQLFPNDDGDAENDNEEDNETGELHDKEDGYEEEVVDKEDLAEGEDEAEGEETNDGLARVAEFVQDDDFEAAEQEY